MKFTVNATVTFEVDSELINSVLTDSNKTIEDLNKNFELQFTELLTEEMRDDGMKNIVVSVDVKESEV